MPLLHVFNAAAREVHADTVLHKAGGEEIGAGGGFTAASDKQRALLACRKGWEERKQALKGAEPFGDVGRSIYRRLKTAAVARLPIGLLTKGRRRAERASCGAHP